MQNFNNASAQRATVHGYARSPNLAAFSRERVLFIGTQFSILYTFVYSPA